MKGFKGFDMLHENNVKVLMSFTAKDYAEAYRNYVNNAYTLGGWFSIYFPEDASDYDAMQILNACKRFHELGL